MIQTGLVGVFQSVCNPQHTELITSCKFSAVSLSAAPVWFPVLLLLLSSDSHQGKHRPRVPFPCTASAPRIPSTIVVNQNTGTMKLLVTLEVTEIIGLISSFLLYLHT